MNPSADHAMQARWLEHAGSQDEAVRSYRAACHFRGGPRAWRDLTGALVRAASLSETSERARAHLLRAHGALSHAVDMAHGGNEENNRLLEEQRQLLQRWTAEWLGDGAAAPLQNAERPEPVREAAQPLERELAHGLQPVGQREACTH